MAKLSPEILTTIFSLQRRLIELIAETKITEFSLFERYGETEETLPELEQIQNCFERLKNPYSRLHTLTLRISEYYPVAPSAILELLSETIEQAQLSADVVAASLSETQKNWRL
ncbi:hypothetical protein ACN4EE_17790 [Geminocystis sp. CENA526]